MISLHGAYHPNNYGDVLIMAIQSKWIEEITNKKVVLPFATKYYRDAIRPAEKMGKEGLNLSDKLIYGAGGYLGEPIENKWKWGFSFFKKHVYPAEFAIREKKEYAIIGTGIGPITNRFTRYELTRIIKNAKIVAVRDIESKIYLEKYGIIDKEITVTADVALSLEIEDLPQESIEKIKEKISLISGIKYGIHLGVDLNSELYGHKAKILYDKCIEFINSNETIAPILIVDNDNYQQNKSIEYLRSKINRECIIYKYEDIWEMTALLAELDAVLTNKLHVGIVSYTLGTLPISFPYHPKTKRFYKQIKQENLCIPLLESNVDDIEAILNNSLDRKWRADFFKSREQVLPELKEKSLENKKIMEEFLN